MESSSALLSDKPQPTNTSWLYLQNYTQKLTFSHCVSPGFLQQQFNWSSSHGPLPSALSIAARVMLLKRKVDLPSGQLSLLTQSKSQRHSGIPRRQPHHCTLLVLTKAVLDHHACFPSAHGQGSSWDADSRSNPGTWSLHSLSIPPALLPLPYGSFE